MSSGDGEVIKVVVLSGDRTTIMNVAKHTIPVQKLGRVIAVVGGPICSHVNALDDRGERCVWCENLRMRCAANRKD